MLNGAVTIEGGADARRAVLGVDRSIAYGGRCPPGVTTSRIGD